MIHHLKLLFLKFQKEHWCVYLVNSHRFDLPLPLLTSKLVVQSDWNFCIDTIKKLERRQTNLSLRCDAIFPQRINQYLITQTLISINQFIDNGYQILVVGFCLTVAPWVIISRMGKSNIILKEKLSNLIWGKIGGIIYYYLIWNTKYTHNIFLYEVTYHLRCGMLNRYFLNPLGKIICHSQNIVMTYNGRRIN